MGLQICGYSDIQLTNFKTNQNGESINSKGVLQQNTFQVAASIKSKGYAPNIIEGAIYQYRDSYGADIGSCTGFSDWRNDLANLAGYNPLESCGLKNSFLNGARNSSCGPFLYLLKCPDTECFLDADVSKAMFKDFIEFDARAYEFSKNQICDHFYETYLKFKKTFEISLKNGVVAFS